MKAMPRQSQIHFTQPDIDAMGQAFALPSFDASIAAVLAGQQLQGMHRILSGREADFAVAYGVRNKAAHGLERPSAIAIDFDKVVERLYFTVFAIVESLIHEGPVPWAQRSVIGNPTVGAGSALSVATEEGSEGLKFGPRKSQAPWRHTARCQAQTARRPTGWRPSEARPCHHGSRQAHAARGPRSP